MGDRYDVRMGSTGANGIRGRVEREIRSAMAAIKDEPDGEAALKLASWLTETLRQATIGAGELRAAVALRERDRRKLSFTELGQIMGVTRARASEIVGNARHNPAADTGMGQPGIALAVITAPQGILVSRRTDRTPPYSFVGGEIEDGEGPGEAAVREVAEEVGLEAEALDVISERVHPSTGRLVSYVACRLTDPPDVPAVVDHGELTDVRWADLAETLRLMPTMHEPVRDYLAREMTGGRPSAEFTAVMVRLDEMDRQFRLLREQVAPRETD